MLRILDLGCGAAGTAALARRFPANRMVGVDIDMAALRRARQTHPGFDFVCARGEQLPFRDGVFDAVHAQVALPYMDIPATLHQVARVLKTGGALRAKLHPFTYTLSELREELRSGGVIAVKNFIYRLYVLSHGVALHVAGVGFRFPLARRRCESFQTRRSIRRAMERAGFETIDTSNWETAIARPHAGNCWVEAMKRLG